MAKPSSVVATTPALSALEGLFPRPMVFPDEDRLVYEDLRDAFLADLAPGTPYEQALAENLVTLEWEAIRHRRMRDTLIKAKARDLAVGFAATGRLREVASHEFDANHRKIGFGLVGTDRNLRAEAVAALEERDMSLDEVFAEAYSRVAERVDLHEKKLADLEIRRRRLREDFDRLKAARARPVEDAEVIG